MGLPPGLKLITGVTAKGIPGKADDYLPQIPARTAQLNAAGMNKTEAAYAIELELLQRAGKIQAWWWASGSLRISDPDPTTKKADYYRPDFLVWHLDGSLEYVEIKGFLRDDARTKFKVAATTFPCYRFRMLRHVRGKGFVVVMGEECP